LFGDYKQGEPPQAIDKMEQFKGFKTKKGFRDFKKEQVAHYVGHGKYQYRRPQPSPDVFKRKLVPAGEGFGEDAKHIMAHAYIIPENLKTVPATAFFCSFLRRKAAKKLKKRQ
jgi:hypothetical protein